MSMHLSGRTTALLLSIALGLSPAAGVSAEKPAGSESSDKPKASRAKKSAPKKSKTRRRSAKRRSKRSRKKWPVRRPKAGTVKIGVPKLGNIPFREGERLVFSVSMLGAEAADVVLGVGKRSIRRGRPIVPLLGWLRSSDFLSKFYPIDDKLEVLVDERSFAPIQSDFAIREKGKTIDYHTRYEKRGSRIRSDKRTLGKKTLKRRFRAAGSVYDALSSVYAARRLDLKVGSSFTYYVWDGLRERLVTVRAVKQEKVWTRVGWFETIRLDITTRVTGGFIKAKALDAPEKHGSAWIGLDPARTPVKLVTPTKLGEAQATLVRRYFETDDAAAPPPDPAGMNPKSSTAPPAKNAAVAR